MTNNPTDADVAFIKALAEILNESELTEVSVKRSLGEDDYLNVRLSKQAAAPQAPAAAPAAPAAAPAPAATAERSGSAPAGLEEDDPARHPGALTSPMVGTAYMAPEPGAEPFVTVGSQVNEGETVMIIEAMKTMNHIPASHGGTVRRILVSDGAPVEYGAPLMIIE